MDQFGNLYFIHDNTLIKYSPDFIKKINYTNNTLGEVYSVDATIRCGYWFFIKILTRWFS